jgi:hypothetical protein
MNTVNQQNGQQLDPDSLALIRQAGLEQAATQFPEDVLVAMRSAAQARASLAQLAPADGTTEPWPPMRMRGAA